MTKRASVSDPWEPPVNAGPIINSASHDIKPSLSADGLILLFTSRRPGGYGGRDVWFASRTTINDPWGAPVNAGPSINTPNFDMFAELSADGSTLYFSSMRPGGPGNINIWQASVIPIVDFTGDYKVDIDDLLLLIEHWGQNEPAYDMGPALGRWRDRCCRPGSVDEYWGQELYDPNLLAHWELDEAESTV